MLFREEQQFGRALRWLFLALQVIPLTLMVVALQTNDGEALGAALASFVVIALVQVWLLTARLVTVVDQEALRISFRWIWPTRTVKHRDIERYEDRAYGMFDSGGWGVHIGMAGWTYNARGNRGVAIKLKDGSRLLVGSQMPEALVRAMHEARASAGAPSGP